MSLDGTQASAPRKKKYFVALENNPEVFTDLVHHLGVSSKLGFYDVYDIHDASILSMVPRPVLALIFIAPTAVWNERRKADFPPGITSQATLPTYAASGPDEPVLWFQQTIGNACGLMSLIHATANGPAKSFVAADSDYGRLLQAAVPLKMEERAQLLFDSELLEKSHALSAVKGDTVPPGAEDNVPFHFITFVKGDDGHMWEMEGGWVGPIDRGMLDETEDMLSERALENGVVPYLRAGEGMEGLHGELGFSIVALAAKD